jgi:hypothetical protein
MATCPAVVPLASAILATASGITPRQAAVPSPAAPALEAVGGAKEDD